MLRFGDRAEVKYGYSLEHVSEDDSLLRKHIFIIVFKKCSSSYILPMCLSHNIPQALLHGEPSQTNTSGASIPAPQR